MWRDGMDEQKIGTSAQTEAVARDQSEHRESIDAYSGLCTSYLNPPYHK